MTDWSSEKIAKALKGSGLNTKERINIAIDAWNNDKIFFPNKDDFLFDWLCFALASKPNTKNLLDSPIFEKLYWQLLVDLLQHYNNIQPTTMKPTALPIIRVPLIATVSTVLNHIYTTYKDDNNLRFTLVRDICSCVQLLMSDVFRPSYHPTLEQMTTLVENILTACSYQIQRVQQQKEEPKDEVTTLKSLIELFRMILIRYTDQLVQAGNQKKVATMVISKLMHMGLHVRRQLLLMKDEKYLVVAQHFTDMLCHVLFHTDTIMEYTSVLKESTNNNINIKNASYVSKVFEELTDMVIGSDNIDTLKDALDVLPTLLSQFIKNYRGKRNTIMAPTQDVHRLVEFGFFIQSYDIAEKAKIKSMDTFLKTEAQLLEQVLTWNVFTARNDDISKTQYEYLNSLASESIEYLKNKQECDQLLVLDIINFLLQIDISLIESRMGSIWPTLLQPLEHAEFSCLSLGRMVLKTYAASRQLDVFIDELLNAISHSDCQDIYSVLRKPLFSKSFLQEFSSTIGKHVPVPQTLAIFERFTKSLKNNLNMQASAIKDSELQPKLKKAKLAQRSHYSNTKPTSLLITTFFVEFIKSLRLGQHQRQAFERVSIDLFNSYVKPSLCDTMDIGQSVLPALQTHFALSNAFYDAYWLNLSSNSRNWLISELKSLFKLENDGETQSSRIFMVYCANALFQHVYFSTLSENKAASSGQNFDLVSVVLELVLDGNDDQWQYTTWDGQLVSLSDVNKVKLALWKLITDEWFVPVCHAVQGHVETARSLTSLVLLSNIHQQPSQTISSNFTMQTVNSVLLRSAHFYETTCFHDQIISMLLGNVIHLFQDMAVTDDNGITNMIVKEIKQIDLSVPFIINKEKWAEIGTTLTLSLTERMDSDEQQTYQSSVDSVCRLMNLLLLFPIEYFRKQERSYVLMMSFLVDAWLLSCEKASLQSRIHGSLACRSLYLRFMNVAGNSVLGSSPSILQWWVHVLDTKISVDDDVTNPLKYDIHAWIQVTKSIDQKVESTMLAMASGKNSDSGTVDFVRDTLQDRIRTMDVHKKLPFSFLWTLSFMDALVKSLPNYKKKHENMEESDILGTIPKVTMLSNFINKKLDKYKQRIDLTLSKNGNPTTISYSELAQLFHGVRVVQDYAGILKSHNQGVDATELSETMVGLISPMVSLLRSCLGSRTTEAFKDVLDMTTSFVGAVCTTLSRDDQCDSTKQVLSVVWVVYGLVYEAKNTNATESIGNLFSKWIQSLNNDQFSLLITSFVEQMNTLEIPAKNDESRKSHHIFLSLAYMLFAHGTEAQKQRLRPTLPSFILKLASLIGNTTNIEFLDKTLDLLVHLTNDNAYGYQCYDVSLILLCLQQVIHPNTISFLAPQVDDKLAHLLFEKICHILGNLARLHRDGLSDTMGPFVALLQSLLLCFKSAQVSLITQTKNSIRKRKAKESSTISSGSSTGLLASHAPLGNLAAEQYARVITQLATKSTGSKKNDYVYLNISKHMPYILLNYFTIQSDPVMNITLPALKTALSFGWYELLNMCTTSDRSMIMSGLNSTGQAIFKSFYNNWNANYKYSGQ